MATTIDVIEGCFGFKPLPSKQVVLSVLSEYKNPAFLIELFDFNKQEKTFSFRTKDMVTPTGVQCFMEIIRSHFEAERTKTIHSLKKENFIVEKLDSNGVVVDQIEFKNCALLQANFNEIGNDLEYLFCKFSYESCDELLKETGRCPTCKRSFY